VARQTSAHPPCRRQPTYENHFKGEKMKKLGRLPVVVGALGLSAISAFADTVYGADITPDYTDFKAAVGLVLGIVVVVMLAKRAKGFFR